MIKCNKISLQRRFNIIKYNIKECYKNIIKDFKSAKTISDAVCELDIAKQGVYTLEEPVIKTLTTIRELAKNRYNRDFASTITKEIEGELNV